MENKRKHLEFIQGIISRMAGNLFFLRGWTITLIGALLALFSKNNSPDYIFYFLILVVFILWILEKKNVGFKNNKQECSGFVVGTIFYNNVSDINL